VALVRWNWHSSAIVATARRRLLARSNPMKIESLTLKNFKRFDNLTIEFKNGLTGEIANRFLILGDNGTGKTTVLQAIALCLSMLTGRIQKVSEFDWIGWVPGRYWRWGSPEIEMVVHFTDDEFEASLEAARRLQQVNGPDSRTAPHGLVHSSAVRGGIKGEQLWTSDSVGVSLPLFPLLNLFRGRNFAASMLRKDPSILPLFERLPGIFWFDQFRNLATAPGSREVESNGSLKEEPAERVPYAVGISQLRQYLNRWKLQQLQASPRPGEVNYLKELEGHYKRIFPGRSFADPEPMFRGGVPSPTDYYFMLSDGNPTYDIEEMSAGEQAVFPMLFEFVRQRIRNSIVLIDEIDLNLHPPLAQALLANLPRLGPQCQFIFTTHSSAISEIVSPHEILRLEGGLPCL
jgi:predicted ATPase